MTAIGPQIQTIETAERFSDLTRSDWLIIARRAKGEISPRYVWDRDDTKKWSKAMTAGKVTAVTRDDGRYWVTLGKVVSL